MIEEPETTVVNRLEFLQDATKIHSNILHIISRDYIFAYLPEEKKEPLSKLIGQFNFGYWLKRRIAETPMREGDPQTSEEDKRIIEKSARETFDMHMVPYNTYVTMKRNEQINPIIEMSFADMRISEDEPQQMDNKEALKEITKIKKGDKE